MTAFTQLQTRLQAEPHAWLITGVAGFIGSNLLETQLKLNQRVVGLDNFAAAPCLILLDRCSPHACKNIFIHSATHVQ